MNSIHGVPSFSFLLFCCCFYLPHKVLNIATISSEPIHMIPSPLPKHYCYLHSKNLHGSYTCKSEISWHYREESPSKQNRCREKKDLKTGIRSYARWHEIEIIMVQIQKHPLRDLNLLAALNTYFFPDEKVSLSLWHRVSKLRIKDCCWFRLMSLASIGLTSQY